MTGRSEKLRALIAREITAAGPIPFARFMELALYAPELGYYTGPRAKIGPEGDFFTALDLHPAFGGLVGTQVVEMARAVPEGAYTVVEMGAGKGHLAHDVLSAVRAADASLFERLEYRIVDVSPHLVEAQRERLAGFADRITWHEALTELGDVQGVFLSNELVDALPHHQVVMDGGALKEVFVTHREGRFREQWMPPSTPDLGRYFQALGIVLPEGYRTEVNLAALGWIREVARHLVRGHVLTIDYGYPADVYYRPDRRTGTFLCYHEHRVSEDPYARVGEQDMTAHVDFSSLARAGEAAGLRAAGFTDQAHFLVGLGVHKVMERALARGGGDPERSDEFKLLKRLVDPQGMGRTFKVLVQEKGIAPVPLSGLRFSALTVSDLLGADPAPSARQRDAQ
jgi:SAM-dependent MidA family methyltransferase